MRQLPKLVLVTVAAGVLAAGVVGAADDENDVEIAAACAVLGAGGLRDIAADRTDRFQGKVGEVAARCRGGRRAIAGRGQPWVDWSNYWGTSDVSGQYITALAIAPSKSKTIYAATADGHVWTTANNGQNWNQNDSGLFGTGAGKVIEGAYQTPIMVQWRPAREGVRTVDVTLTKFQ